jgi:hypothetical protein
MLSNYYHQRMEEDRRRERLASRERDHVVLRQESELEDQRQERRERWTLEKRERYAALAMHLVLFVCTLVLLIVGSSSGRLSVLGGSGVTGLLTVLWTQGSFGRRKESRTS